MSDITSDHIIALLRCASENAPIETDDVFVFLDDFAVTRADLDRLLPYVHLLDNVDRVLWHGDPEPVDDFFLDGRPRQRHYFTVDSHRHLFGELWTTGTDGGAPWVFVRPTNVGPPDVHRFDSWADIPKLMFPLLWKPNGRDT